MNPDLFDFADEIRRIALREAGAAPHPGPSGFSAYWVMPDGRIITETEAFAWLALFEKAT